MLIGHEVKHFLREKVKSREWWILVPESSLSYVVVEIEEKFYSGEASADFAAILGMTKFGLVSVYTAHKSRMSAKDIVALIGDRGVLPVSEGQLKKHDIIFLTGWAQSEVLMAQLDYLLNG